MTQNYSFIENVFKRSQKARRPFQQLETARPDPGQPPVPEQKAPPASPPGQQPPITHEMLTRPASGAQNPVSQPQALSQGPQISLEDVSLPPISKEMSSPDWTDQFYQTEGRLPNTSDAVFRSARIQFEQARGRPPTRNELLVEMLNLLNMGESSSGMEF